MFYPQIFAAVQCGLLVSRGRCPICKFVPNPMNNVPNMATSASGIHARNSSKLAGRFGTKTLSLTYLHTETYRGVKSGDRGGQGTVPPSPIHAATMWIEVGSDPLEWKRGGGP